jgi:hypothetical protein
MYFGTLCGYIVLTEYFSEKEINNLIVHGGITYNQIGLKKSVQTIGFKDFNNKIVIDFEDFTDKRVIGFDCCHSFDLTPITKYLNFTDLMYRDISYVINELIKLDKQLKELK